ncbi:MAG: hypothetical protein A2Y62_02450 [Candidatus Fischerbacteria bacterium RBG_13_37_8]|uniref:Cyclic nucleotide-binding domain-containing protein n=1 Tax=Candidatus Fischerbacteria bacterium RBG_13_37_8 TaxID=1817863 RepID=A0A1F5VIK8_9BACT|nr:MAG: hypothetical protein A2Y62_02450 [Candidatus Fischerbacteria bacterium RBG_13_37_8]
MKTLTWNHRQCIMLTHFIIEQYQHFEYIFFSRKFKRNQVIYLMGDSSDELFYIKDGKVKTSIISIDGKERILELYDKGNYFGEICLCTDGKRPEQAIAYEDSVLSSLKTRDFISLLNTHKDMMHYFLNFFSKKLSEYATKLEKSNNEYASFKIAKYLIKSAKNKINARNNNDDRKILLSLTNDQLANKVSLETKLVNEILIKFYKENLIEYRKQNIVAYFDRLKEYILK